MADDPDHREMTKLTETTPAWPSVRICCTIGATSSLTVVGLSTSRAARRTSSWTRVTAECPSSGPK
jgi:hypothetical protein